ncbi:MAG: bifunctional riboflavin kinase/FAD synthetase [Syntrophobacterales bacterium]|nr:bifunctional riboflavin kinase/FAD synthetase [Syntrophobacterales bacterium]
MDIIRGSENIPADLQGVFATIGNFDGIHLGHRYIFQRMAEEAGREGCKTVLISFDPHPKMVLHPDRRPFYLISSAEEKISLLREIGIGAFLIIPFSLEYSQTTAGEFVREILWEKLRIRKIIIGHDYTFGHAREGNEAFLAAEGRRLGFAVEAMNAFCAGSEIVSSTKIREAILQGDVRFAAALLGRPYNISGRVVAGDQRGVELGFPTANVEANKELLPPHGVYAVRCLLKGKSHDGVVNVGFNPTFAGGKLSVEVHIFDFNQDIYGEILDVLFFERLRAEIRFESPAKLIAQIKRDVIQARALLSTP